METNSWLYSIIMVIYALGLLLYAADFLLRNINAKRTGTGLIVFVWGLQALYFLARSFQGQYIPVITLFEVLFFFSWAMVTVALVLFLMLRQEFVFLMLGTLGFISLLSGLFIDPTTAAAIHHLSFSEIILLIHMSLGIISYAAFTAAAVYSGIYLFLHWKLKVKQWSPGLKRLPSLDATELYAFRSVIAGASFLLISLSFGVWRIWIIDEIHLLIDPKVLTSVLLFGVYSLYIMLKLGLLISGKRLALWNLAAYGIMLINFVISNYISGFHDWIWIT